MLFKTLVMVIILFALKIIVRSVEDELMIIECKNEASCLEKVWENNLQVGLVPIFATMNKNPERDLSILYFFKRYSWIKKVLKVDVSPGANKALVSYLFPGQNSATYIPFPFVVLMRDHRLLQNRMDGYDLELLEDLLNKAHTDFYIQRYSDFSSDVLSKIENYNKYYIRAVKPEIREAIINQKPISSTQQTVTPAASLTGVTPVRAQRKTYDLVLEVSSDLQNSGNSGWNKLPRFVPNTSTATSVSGQKRKAENKEPNLPNSGKRRYNKSLQARTRQYDD